MTRVPKQVYTVLELQGPKFQIFTAKFYKPQFKSILPKSTNFSKSFGCLAASKHAQSFQILCQSKIKRTKTQEKQSSAVTVAGYERWSRSNTR
jgi:hypothetical protein